MTHRLSGHMSSERLLEYFEGMLLEDDERMIEEHLADCDACTRVARTVFVFQRHWETWTPEAHGADYRRVAVAKALAAAANDPGHAKWRERLVKWSQRWSEAVTSTGRFLLEPATHAGRLLMESLEAITLEVDPALARNDLSRGGEAFRQVRILTENGPDGEVHVLIENIKKPVPLVILLPEGGKPIAKIPTQLGDENKYLAHFQVPEEVDYTLAIEPFPVEEH